MHDFNLCAFCSGKFKVLIAVSPDQVAIGVPHFLPLFETGTEYFLGESQGDQVLSGTRISNLKGHIIAEFERRQFQTLPFLDGVFEFYCR